MDLENNNNKLADSSATNLEASLGFQVKNSIKETCMDTTLMGIPNVLKERSHIILKIIWSLGFLACFCACMYYVIIAFQQYLTWPTYFQVVNYEEIPAPFPMISFCNMKPVVFGSPTVESYLLTYVLDFYQLKSFYTSLFEWSQACAYLLRILVNQDPHKVITDTNRKSYGYEIENMLISCYFNYQPCYSADFTYFYHSYYGNCYTFNSGVYSNGTKYRIKTSSLSGAGYGLNLELYLGDPYYTWDFHINDGIYLAIQNQSSKPLWSGNILKVSSAAETDFIIKRNFVTNLPSPYGTCTLNGSDSSYYNYIVKTLGTNYDEMFCFQLCLQDNIVKYCGCYSSFYPAYGANSSNSYCNTLNLKECMLNYTSTSDITKSCRTLCPYNCSYTKYDILSTRGSYPNYRYMANLDGFLLSQRGIKQINKTAASYAKVNIYYEDLRYSTTTETPQILWTDLISNLGGTVGLYIGFSFLTLGEIFEIIFNISFIFITYIVNKRQKLQVNPFHDNTMLSKSDIKIPQIIQEKLIID